MGTTDEALRTGAAPAATGCPHLAGYDPLAPEELRDPYPSFARARREAPVFYSEEMDFWTVTRYEDVLSVLRDKDNFTNTGILPTEDPPESVRAHMAHYPWLGSVLSLDDPEHRQQRLIEQAPFTPRNVKTRESAFRERAETLLDPFEETGKIEFLSEYALPSSLATIGEILGADEEQFDLLKQAVMGQFELMDALLTKSKDEEQLVKDCEVQIEFTDYIAALIEERRENPRDDYTSVMIQTQRPDGSYPTTEELTVGLTDLLEGGFETVTQATTLGVMTILQHPEQWEALKRDPGLAVNAVDEMLRYRSLVKRTFRITVNDVEVGGVKIPAGSRVALSMASSNHDEDVFEDPNVFDIVRERPQHIAFGKWKHFCVGAQLARLEMRVTFEVLVDRFPEMRLAPDQELEWRHDLRLDGVQALQLETPTV